MCVCSHSIGRPKHARVMTGGLEGDVFIGPKAEVSTHHCTLLESGSDKAGCMCARVRTHRSIEDC